MPPSTRPQTFRASTERRPEVLLISRRASTIDHVTGRLSGSGWTLNAIAGLHEALELLRRDFAGVLLVDHERHAPEEIQEMVWLREVSALVPVLVLKASDDTAWSTGCGVGGLVDCVTWSTLSAEHLDRAWTRAPTGWTPREKALLIGKLQAEQRCRDRSHWMTAISHDLRQPLHALGLFVGELATDGYPTPLADLGVRMGMTLHSMESMLDSLLTLSQLSAGQVIANRRPVPLLPLLERLKHIHQPAADRRPLRLTIASCQALVWADAGLLERMLSNLVGNAIRYTERGGVLLACRRRGQHLRLEVWDTGIGIPAHAREQVFQPFERLPRHEGGLATARATVHGSADLGLGLGLGLAIVRSCAQLMGCTVELESVVGRGSRFAFELPLLDPQDKRLQSDTPHGALDGYLNGVRVLWVEAEGQPHSAVAELLSDWGCRVHRQTPASLPRHAGSGQPQAEPPWQLLAAEDEAGQTAEAMDRIALARARTGSKLPALLVTEAPSRATVAMARQQGITVVSRTVAPSDLQRMLGALVHLRPLQD